MGRRQLVLVKTSLNRDGSETERHPSSHRVLSPCTHMPPWKVSPQRMRRVMPDAWLALKPAGGRGLLSRTGVFSQPWHNNTLRHWPQTYLLSAWNQQSAGFKCSSGNEKVSGGRGIKGWLLHQMMDSLGVCCSPACLSGVVFTSALACVQVHVCVCGRACRDHAWSCSF